MSRKAFHKNLGPFTLANIATHIGCEIAPEAQKISIHAVKSLTEAGVSDLTFLSNAKYIPEFKASKAAACIVPLDFFSASKHRAVLLKVDNPRHACANVLDLFYTSGKPLQRMIMPSAYVAASARLGKHCYIGHNVVIEDDVEIGDDCIIESGSLIDFNVKIGQRARIDANVAISHATIGNDVVILPGARIGQDGFGFSTSNGVHKRIYHAGHVIIGNDVEIGANTCIDRGSAKDTIIEDHCRIDNLVQIGHNIHIKQGTILAAQVGIAGSSTIGSYCMLAGQSGVAEHVHITDGVKVAGKGGVAKDIKVAGIVAGAPAIPIKDWHRQTIALKNLSRV
mmetsp:Transcript_6345/g.14349  ORF Transcript_6345/g.14349 Transcript_6345/m.14349 type:complete len:338 (+) Transcript_6345:441-1454(+)